MRICYICKKNLSKSESSHLKKCANIDYIKARYNQLIFDFKDFDLSEDNFKKLYYDGYSLIDFKNKFGLAYKQTNFLIDFYNIIRREKEQINKIKREKYKKTCLSKYNQYHHTTIDTIDKIKKTCLSKYGVDNIFKDKDFIHKSILTKKEKYGKSGLGWINEDKNSKRIRIDNLHNSLKRWWEKMDYSERSFRIELLKDYRFKWWSNLSMEDKMLILNSMKDNFHSKLEERICNILNNMNIKYKKQIWINRMSYDILIKKTILEINGDFWHCNPKKYNENFFHPYIKMTANEIWEKDEYKKINAEKYGYKVVYIWEDFITNSTDEQILEFINKIGF